MEFTTLTQLYRDAVSNRPRSDMFRYKRDGRWVSVSTEDFDRAVGECAAALLVHGVEAGDRVALLSENRLEWAMVDIATQRIGAVLVPDLPHAAATADRVHPRRLRTGGRFLLRPRNRWPSSTASRRRSLRSAGRVLRTGRPRERSHARAPPRPRAPQRGITEGRGRSPLRRRRTDDLATIIYTSGTTGQPKGVMLTHGNIAGNVTAGLQVLDVTPADVCLSFLPLSHILERMAGHYLMIGSGVSINYAESIETVAADMGEVRPTLMVSVPRDCTRRSTRGCSRTRTPAAPSSAGSSSGRGASAASTPTPTSRDARSRPPSSSSAGSATRWCSRSCARAPAAVCASSCRAARRSPRRSPSSSTRPDYRSWRATA